MPRQAQVPPAATTPAISSRNVGVKPFTVFTDMRIARALFTFSHEIGLQLTMDVFNIINKNNTLDVNLLYTAAGTPVTHLPTIRGKFQFGARVSLLSSPTFSIIYGTNATPAYYHLIKQAFFVVFRP